MIDRRILAALALPLVLAGCDQNSAPVQTQSGSPPPPAQAQPGQPETPPPLTPAEGEMAVAGILFPVPEGWRQVAPSNQMRLAELHYGEGDSLCVAAFSTAGGSVIANIERWAMQMQGPGGEPLTAQAQMRQVSGVPVHTVELTGTYLGMGQQPAQPDTTMRGAILERPTGLLFIKMTGPADAMEACAPGWETLVNGLRTN
ncbi:MAG: hypothetical protein ACF8R7_18235 [Phycisphaerales bacterium JB039]